MASTQREQEEYLQQMIKDRPETWRLCHPRTYNDVGAYHSSKLVGLRLFEIASKIDQGHRGQAEMYEFQVACRLVKYRVPTFFIAPPIMEAMTNTATPSDIPWMDMPLPFEAAVFMVPKGTLQHPTQGDAAFIGYARFEVGCKDFSKLNNMHYGVTNGGMILFAISMKDMMFYHWNLTPEHLGERITLRELEEYKVGWSHHQVSKGFGAVTITPEDDAFFVRVAHYIFSSLLIMTERPEMVTMGKLEKRVAKANDLPKEFWSPNVVGANYSMKREGAKGDGQHASPRFHFVRGFWRNQVHGAGRTLRRLQWVEPYMRGLDTNEV